MKTIDNIVKEGNACFECGPPVKVILPDDLKALAIEWISSYRYNEGKDGLIMIPMVEVMNFFNLEYNDLER